MSNRIGSSTIYTSILPTGSKLQSVKLSKQAKQRLRVIDYYHKTGNASLTCRHFGIARSYLYKWLGRYNPKYLASLESRSTRPRKVRRATYNTDFIALIRKLRTDFPSYSAKKLAWIVMRDYGYTYSAATIGRIIQRFKLYFSKAIQLRKRHKAARKSVVNRKPYSLKATAPRSLIEFDMKHIWRPGNITRYAFVAIDVITKQTVIHVGSRPSSAQAKVALEKVLQTFGQEIAILNDNGSENLGRAYEFLKDQNITQYFARPRTPKDKPHVENLIGKLQLECLDEQRDAVTVLELQQQINRWVNDYHFFRPHQALNYQTPQEFCDTLDLTIPRAEVSTM